MIKQISDVNTDRPYIRKITFEYDDRTDNDILNQAKNLIKNRQNTCYNCQNYYEEGILGGYYTPCCKIYGYLEQWDNPHHDSDGNKCNDYKRKEEITYIGFKKRIKL